MRHVLYVCLLLSMIATTGIAQVPEVIPESATTRLYFPQFADGGPLSGQWQTIFTLANPNPVTVSGTLQLFNNDGGSLAIDFGTGPTSQVSFSVAPFGTRIFQSRIASGVTITGWAFVSASNSLQGVVTYRYLQNGKASSEVSVSAALPTTQYFSAASSFTGLAVSNIYRSNSSVHITARGNDGSSRQTTLSLPPLSKRSFSLIEVMPGLGSSFSGTVTLDGLQTTGVYYYFVALTLRSETGALYSSLPSGSAARPSSMFDKIQHVFARLLEVTRGGIFPSPDSIQLTIDETSLEPNAFAAGNRVTINLALAELIADSESELAFAIAHELGHVYQFQSGGQRFFNPNSERDADGWGMLLATSAGYDSYAGAGVLAKISMATGTAGLLTQFFEGLSTNVHGSFNDRLENIYVVIQAVCTLLPSSCSQTHSLYHPHLEGGLFLTVPDAVKGLVRPPL